MPPQFPTVLELVGETPIVRLAKLSPPGGAQILAKLEYLNPGRLREGPDRDADDRGGRARRACCKPGGTIVEPTSGNTGVGLAIAAAIKGYRCIFVMPDKMSQEKIALLRAYGAEVVITPTAVDRDSPESYYSRRRPARRGDPGRVQAQPVLQPGQPEDALRDDRSGDLGADRRRQIDVFVAGVGTGGTITGVGALPQGTQAGDPRSSAPIRRAPSTPATSRLHPYLVEGIGEDFWPETFDPTVVDRWVRVTTATRSCWRAAPRPRGRHPRRRIGRHRGVAALADRARLGRRRDASLVMLPDTGRHYLSKIYDDSWMLQHGFLERPAVVPTVDEVLHAKTAASCRDLVTVRAHEKVGEAVDTLQRTASPRPRSSREDSRDVAHFVGSIRDRELLERVFANPDVLQADVASAMQPPLGAVETSATLEDVFATLSGGANAIVVCRTAGRSAS